VAEIELVRSPDDAADGVHAAAAEGAEHAPAEPGEERRQPVDGRNDAITRDTVARWERPRDAGTEDG